MSTGMGKASWLVAIICTVTEIGGAEAALAPFQLPTSATRASHESYEQTQLRNSRNRLDAGGDAKGRVSNGFLGSIWHRRPVPGGSGGNSSSTASPWSERQALEAVDLARVPSLESMEQLQAVFEKVRDVRAWRSNQRPSFARRIPWLFMIDGCYLRAELVAEKFKEWGLPVPQQAMVFGDLNANSEYEAATWWYHVAPVLKVSGRAYVLDASLDSRRPLPLESWILRMAPTVGSITLSICNPEVVDPYVACGSVEPAWSMDYKSELIQYFLDQEWDKLRAIFGFEPTELLGELPPWRSSH